MESNSKLILVYSLEMNANNESLLFRCDKYNTIEFILGSTLFGRQIILYTNYSNDLNKFSYYRYHDLKFDSERASIRFENSGSFHFYYTERKNDSVCGNLYIVVNPKLTVGINSNLKQLDLNAIQCQTVLSKCLGKFETWKSKLEVSKRIGYNMIHLTPIQELGRSKSSYSLSNQLKLNPEFSSNTKEYTFEDVSQLIKWMRSEWNVLSITDIVLNHTANESEWLRTHPECAYNCLNSPWLRPAYLLDRLIWHFTRDIIDERWQSRGLNTQIDCENHLNLIRDLFHEQYLPDLNLHELYLVDINQIIKELDEKLHIYCENCPQFKSNQSYSKIKIIEDPKYRRFKSTIDMNNAIIIVENEVDFKGNIEEWIEWSLEYIRSELSILNQNMKKEINYHLSCAVENVISAVRYERLDSNGPKIKLLSKERPLVPKYFTHEGLDHDLLSEEQMMFDDNNSQYLMAQNGWVMTDDPLRNFAEHGSNVYIRRELIVWSDSVKLRYGSGPEDCPFLWTHMENYVTQMARMFHGIRLDNCHSTPIHLAQHMISAARKVNPDLYLIAELFTSNEQLDNIFVNKLGINSLIREAMSAGDAHELGRQVFRYGGEPVGAFPPETLSTGPSEFLVRPFRPSVSHAIFYDLTHDNESPIIRRSAYDPLPSAALVSMTYSAIGSNRGFDELVPHHINVVHESREYNTWDESGNNGVSMGSGIIQSKQAFNSLHEYLGTHGFDESYVDQRDVNTIAVTRHNPNTHESVVLVSRTSFSPPSDPSSTGYLVPLRIDGRLENIILETRMIGKPEKDFTKDNKVINGLKNLKTYLRSNLSIDKSEMIKSVAIDDSNEIMFTHFPPSSVVAFKVSLSEFHLKAVNNIKNIIQQFDDNKSEINSIFNELSLNDLNFVLFRCNQEEIDDIGGGTYRLPSIGALNYCGIASIVYYLKHIRTNNDLGHPLCGNLRDGDWLTRYIVERLAKRSETLELSQWLSTAFSSLSQLPRYLIPRYFDAIIIPVYKLILSRIWSLSSLFIRDGSEFVKLLSLGSIALIGTNRTALLPPLSPKVTNGSVLFATIAAGLPHFASGYMRNWGRDTFISIKGLLLLSGRFTEAKWIILGFAGTLRHGLIPNLLDGGKNARYNCRDAVWWWLQAIKDYCLIAPNGIELLSAPVRRLYPNDDSPPLMDDEQIIEEPLFDTMQEALQRHYNGIDFIERNAGTQIDAHMTKEGFHVKIGVSRETGFVFGGNVHNCGTWMDKMGSSQKAANKGHPSTPRDGSAVELIGLSKSVITYLSELYDRSLYPYEGVIDSDKTKFSFKEWSHKIQLNFDQYFYISEDSNEQFVNRRKIYKDSYGATNQWQDFQLRPNFLITMVLAPELFERSKAINALNVVKDVLIGPLGVKTLDPSDWNYCGDYDNSNDSDDYKTAHGFNYHNGPEWLWPLGFYLEAKLKFNSDHKHTIVEVKHILSKHYQYLESSDWFGLPELTNSDGKPCSGSCPIQSWSHSTILQVLHLIDVIDSSFV